MKISTIINLVFLVFPSFVFADIYTCVDKNGKKIYQDKPCKDAVTVSVDRSKSVKKKTDKDTVPGPRVLTQADLIGRWTDILDSDLRAYRSIWNFSYGVLNTRKANGVSHRHKYKLEGNILTVYLSKEDAEFEGVKSYEVEILSFDGKTITMGKGAPAGQKYLHKL